VLEKCDLFELGRRSRLKEGRREGAGEVDEKEEK